ncbi:transcriptional regulator family: Fungal Specific TF [Paecilomyces variotii]|nr:transcriptional regulator family: Fungal Specific TF [Paecilomyces variotii]KAJ9224229.1 transcriptional regulator family: Fungal Specific TF [Paecilomyces variotii]KAJ9230672.1 transcriptional regulator family: Fungal Specific TF [Paecilomyces variotii]KAJ9255947.1 transcriptional regulator family: Fungal Specific TF [Paecilomyces variotii]KAJ9286498.1 transcriptional regulator family: Fungal Specific TF [Paecilomyces variotii]
MTGKRTRDDTESEDGSGSSPGHGHSDQLSQGGQEENIEQGTAPTTTTSSQTTTANIPSLTAPLTAPGQTLAAPPAFPTSASSAAVTEGSGGGEPARKKQKKPRRPKDAPSPDWSARVRERLTDAERCPQACDRCTEKKMRCDDEPGDCKNCQGRGVPCWLTDKNSKRTYRRGITPLLVEENSRLWRLVGSMDAEVNRLRAVANSQYGSFGNTYAAPHAPIAPEQYQRQYSRVPFPATPGDFALPPPSATQTAHNSSFQQQSVSGMDRSIENTGQMRLPPPSTNSMQMPALYGLNPTLTGTGERQTDQQQYIYQYAPTPQSLQQYNNTAQDPSSSSYRDLPAPTASSSNPQPPSTTQPRPRNPFPWFRHIPHIVQGQTASRTGSTNTNIPPQAGPWHPENATDAIFNPQRINSMDPSPFVQHGSTQQPSGVMNSSPDAIFTTQRITSMDPSPFIHHGRSSTSSSSQQASGGTNQPQPQPQQHSNHSSWQTGSANLSDTLYNSQRMSIMEPSAFMQHETMPRQSQWGGGMNLDLPPPPPLQMSQQDHATAGNEEQEQQRSYDPSSSGSYGQQHYQP